MKRLFTVNGVHFATKPEAKTARGEPVTKATAADPGVFGSKSKPAVYKHEIHYGPDHWKRNGDVPSSVQPKPVAVKRVRRKAAATGEAVPA